MMETQDEKRYESKEDLPATVKDVYPDEAQDVYLKAYQKAWDSYKEQQGGEMSRESVSHRDAMQALNDEFYKASNGEWRRRSAKPAEEKDGENAKTER